jgi:hypothetical protein
VSHSVVSSLVLFFLVGNHCHHLFGLLFESNCFIHPPCLPLLLKDFLHVHRALTYRLKFFLQCSIHFVKLVEIVQELLPDFRCYRINIELLLLFESIIHKFNHLSVRQTIMHFLFFLFHFLVS